VSRLRGLEIMVFNLLRDELRQAIKDCGYSEPTDVQRSAIPKILDGFNVAMQARTGSGKTAAYLLPTMNMMRGGLTETLIVSPTRELALQITSQFKSFNKYIGFTGAVVYGGVGYAEQVKALRDASLVVATPGRLLDLANRSVVDLGNVKYLIIDEVDRMLDMGFINDINTISSLAGDRRQTHAATATLPMSVRDAINKILVNPFIIRMGVHQYELPMVEQLVYITDGSWRSKYALARGMVMGSKSILFANTRERAYRLYTQLVYITDGSWRSKYALARGMVMGSKSILFANTRERAYRLYTQLRNDGLRVMLLHGGLRQEVRERTLARFRGMRDAALVSTDLASRGLDIIDVNLIVNFDAPRDPETYIHRIGRTARLNNRGKAITLAARSELRILDEAARLTGVDYTIAND